MFSNGRRGFGALLVLLVIGVSLALTAAYTINQNNSQKTKARAQSCGATVGAACCPVFAQGGQPTCSGAGLACDPASQTCIATDGRCMGGTQCDGTQLTQSPNGTSVCGQGNVFYSCRNGSWVNTGTACSCGASAPSGGGSSSGDVAFIGNGCTANDGSPGTCQYVASPNLDSCNDKFGTSYTTEGGHCGGSSNVQCCFKPGTGGGAPPPSSGSGGGGAPPPPASPSRTAHILGGLVQKSDSGARLPGVSVTIGTVDSAGNMLPINGQPSFTTTTDAAGNWAAQVNLTNGDAYYVRPAGTGPAGYASAPRTSNNTHSKAANLGGNTPISQPSYEQQVVGDGDCASTPGWPNGACNFVYDPTGGSAPPPASNPPPASSPPATSGGGGAPPETACLKPLLRYVNLQTSRHFYTSIWSELAGGNSVYKYEGVMGYVESESSPHCYAPSSQPLYRFVNNVTDAHFYLMNNATPPDSNWRLEGVVGYINPAPDPALFTTQLERFVSVQFDDHFYTNNAGEASSLKGGGAYTYEFPAGWTYGDQALSAGGQPPPAGGGGGIPASTGPVTNTPPQTPGVPVTSTGTGAPGYQSFTRMSLDCTNGMSMSASYTPDPVDPTKPNVYYSVVKVTDATQSTPTSGTLIGQGSSPNGGTYIDPHVAWSPGVNLQFYVYTFKENTDTTKEWTIHGVGASGNDVSAANGQPAPQPYSIMCPVGGTPPPGAGQQGPGSTPPPVVAPPVDDSFVKKDMDITFSFFLPDSPGGAATKSPVVTTIPVDVSLVNSTHTDDNETTSVIATYKGRGIWQAKYSSTHYPGSHFSLTLWPDKHAKKTMCGTGATSPQVMFPSTFQCEPNQGTIHLDAGGNTLDFSKMPIGAGDLNASGIRDGVIDSSDLLGIQQMIKTPDRNDSTKGDLNFDGVVNQEDYDLAVWSLQHVTQ